MAIRCQPCQAVLGAKKVCINYFPIVSAELYNSN